MYKALISSSDFKARWSTDDYYKFDRTAVNQSALKYMLKSPYAFYDVFYKRQKPPTAKMKLGQMAHMAILQGSLFKENYVVMPEFESKTADGKPTDSKNTKFYKEQVKAFLESIPDHKMVVTHQEKEDIFGMVDSILSNKMAMALLKDGIPEATGYFRHEATGIKCRFQADFVSFNLNTLVELKTTSDCEWNMFRRSVEGFNYPFQLACYAEGIKQITGIAPKKRVWIAVENVAPYEVRVYDCGPIYEEIGDYEFNKALHDLRYCIDSGTFPQGEKEIVVAEPSNFYRNKYEFNKEIL